MKKILLPVISILLVYGFPVDSQAADLSVSFADSEWTGRNVPNKGICQHRGGKGMSPAISVAGIPAGAAKLELRFTDEDWNSEGAHGIVRFKVPAGSSSVTVPAFQGETNNLPPTIEKVSSHECDVCGGGVYLGPCSGGRGHTYRVYIYAKNAEGDTIARGKLKLGDY